MNETILYLLSVCNEAVGAPLFSDTLCLLMQCILSLFLVIRNLVIRKGRNIYAFLISIVMLGLVQGQIVWIFVTYGDLNGEVIHLLQVLSMDAVRVGNAYCLVVTCIIFYGLMRRRHFNALPKEEVKSVVSQRNSLGAELALWAWIVLAAATLIYILGGVRFLFLSAGGDVRGQAAVLVALSIGKLPFLGRLVRRERARFSEIAMAVFCMCIIMLRSRFMAAFILIQFVVAYHYIYREIGWKLACTFFVSMVLIFFAYGLYREYSGISGGELSVAAWSDFIRAFDAQVTIDWFYGFNVEGFTGFAGILTADMSGQPIVHDFGVSSVGAVMQFIPGKLRVDNALAFGQMTDWFSSFTPYVGSIVPPGLQQAYGHFGILGVFGLAWVIGCLGSKCDLWMRDYRVNRLLIVLISVHILLLIRGTFIGAVFFAVGEIAIFTVFRFLETISSVSNRPTRIRNSVLKLKDAMSGV